MLIKNIKRMLLSITYFKYLIFDLELDIRYKSCDTSKHRVRSLLQILQ